MTEEFPPDVDFSQGNGEYVIERLSEKAVFVGGGPNRYWVEWTEDGLRIRTEDDFKVSDEAKQEWDERADEDEEEYRIPLDSCDTPTIDSIADDTDFSRETIIKVTEAAMGESDSEKELTEEEFKEMMEDRLDRAAEGESASREEVEEVFSDCSDQDTIDGVNLDEHMDNLLDGEAVEEAVVEQTIRENEPLTYRELMNELDEGGRDVLCILERLFEKGDIYEPQRGELRVVQE